MRLPALGAQSIFSGRPLARHERVQIAVLIGIAAGIAALLAFGKMPDMLARDFTYPWRGARALVEGQDPYQVIRPAGPSPFDMWFMYPLTASLAVLPLAFAPVQLAGALFVAAGAALLTYALSTNGMGKLWILASAPFGMAVVLAQWSPILIAAAFLTPLAWLLTCKPIGLALFVARPGWRAASLCAAFLALAFAVQPSWLLQWVRNAQTVSAHGAPVLHPLGALSLLALLRWRRPEARLVGAMTLIPQNLYFYDQLPLLLVARSGRSTFLLVVLSWVAWGLTKWRCTDTHFCGHEAQIPILALVYAPAALTILLEAWNITSFAEMRATWRGMRLNRRRGADAEESNL